MAATRLMPLHAGRGRSVSDALGRTTDYVKDPDKTGNGEWVTAYACNPATAQQEFMFSKRQYAALTGREPKGNDVIAYHLRQSFRPGEATPELANRIGYDLAMSLTKGSHAFIVCTHVDKKHIHSHIVFNSTALSCDRKFRNFWNSTFAVRRLSDILCLENGLSVIEEPKPSRGSYGTWLEGKPPTVRGQLEMIIDDVLSAGCADFDGFLAAMRERGTEVKRGKHLAFRIPGGKRFIRCGSLGEDYSEEAIAERIAGRRKITHSAKEKTAVPSDKPNLLIDIEAKLQQAHSPGFEKWAKIYNLKEMAKTLVFLREKGLTGYSELERACEEASGRYDAILNRKKAIEARKKEISELQKHIGTYGKTRDTYQQYRRLSGKKQEQFYNEHAGEIISCQAAKRYFDSLGLKKLPTIKSLKQEYAGLDAEDRKTYPQLKAAKEELKGLLTAKSNTRRILGMDEEKKTAKRETERQ